MPRMHIESATQVYSAPARFFHWIIALLILTIIPIALVMDGEKIKLSEATQGVLYDTHKLLGLLILAFAVFRILYRFSAGAPAHEPTLSSFQVLVSGLTHWALYALMLAVPLVGYIALQYYGDINLFGKLPIPGFTGHDEKLSERLFGLHKVLGYGMIALIALHFGAALYHYLVRGDNVLGRMWPSALRRSD